MYSPKISEDLIPELYKISKDIQRPMTKAVDDILRSYITLYKRYKSISPFAIKSMLENILENKKTYQDTNFP